MDVEFDGDKDHFNRSKHGVSLSAANDMDFASASIIADERFDYGEPRYWAVGDIDGRLHVLAFTMRGETLRAISLRKANARERKRYARPR